MWNITESFKLQILQEIIESSSSDDEDEILETLFDSTSSSEDSAEDQEKHVSVDSFMDTIDFYSEADFKSHLRLQRSTVENLIRKF